LLRFTTLRFKISLFIIILLIVTAILFTILTMQAMDREITNEVVRRAETVGTSMASAAYYSLLEGDHLALDSLGWKIKEANSDIEYAAVTDAAMKVLAHTDLKRAGTVLLLPSAPLLKQTGSGVRMYAAADGSSSLDVIVPIFFNSRQLGNIVFRIDRSILTQARSDAFWRILIGLAIIVILGTGCIIVLSSFITRPIKELAKGVDELKLGIRPKLNVYSRDELGRLTVSFNHMSELTTRQQERLRSYAHKLEESYLSTIKVVTAAIDARDPYTLGHSTRVAKLAIKIGEALGLSRQELEDLEIASLFHDVGKLKTPDYVLLKNGPLDEEEHRQIVSHCEHGAAILSRAASLQKYIPAVRHHHEWFNGQGYPDGLRGEDIPLHASIIAVADAFDAMTSARPYKRSFSRDEAVLELNRFSGSQFNPWLVEMFQTALDADPLLAEQFSGQG
jgi:putative nucleotidyltransferase with HDIG domain